MRISDWSSDGALPICFVRKPRAIGLQRFANDMPGVGVTIQRLQRLDALLGNLQSIDAIRLLGSLFELRQSLGRLAAREQTLAPARRVDVVIRPRRDQSRPQGVIRRVVAGPRSEKPSVG